MLPTGRMVKPRSPGHFGRGIVPGQTGPSCSTYDLLLRTNVTVIKWLWKVNDFQHPKQRTEKEDDNRAEEHIQNTRGCRYWFHPVRYLEPDYFLSV